MFVKNKIIKDLKSQGVDIEKRDIKNIVFISKYSLDLLEINDSGNCDLYIYQKDIYTLEKFKEKLNNSIYENTIQTDHIDIDVNKIKDNIISVNYNVLTFYDKDEIKIFKENIANLTIDNNIIKANGYFHSLNKNVIINTFINNELLNKQQKLSLEYLINQTELSKDNIEKITSVVLKNNHNNLESWKNNQLFYTFLVNKIKKVLPLDEYIEKYNINHTILNELEVMISLGEIETIQEFNNALYIINTLNKNNLLDFFLKNCDKLFNLIDIYSKFQINYEDILFLSNYMSKYNINLKIDNMNHIKLLKKHNPYLIKLNIKYKKLNNILSEKELIEFEYFYNLYNNFLIAFYITISDYNKKKEAIDYLNNKKSNYNDLIIKEFDELANEFKKESLFKDIFYIISDYDIDFFYKNILLKTIYFISHKFNLINEISFITSFDYILSKFNFIINDKKEYNEFNYVNDILEQAICNFDYYNSLLSSEYRYLNTDIQESLLSLTSYLFKNIQTLDVLSDTFNIVYKFNNLQDYLNKIENISVFQLTNINHIYIYGKSFLYKDVKSNFNIKNNQHLFNIIMSKNINKKILYVYTKKRSILDIIDLIEIEKDNNDNHYIVLKADTGYEKRIW